MKTSLKKGVSTTTLQEIDAGACFLLTHVPPGFNDFVDKDDVFMMCYTNTESGVAIAGGMGRVIIVSLRTGLTASASRSTVVVPVWPESTFSFVMEPTP